MQGITDEAILLSSACDAYVNGVNALDGPLEKDVERAALACWEVRDKPVQVKGRLFRSKTLVVEEPIFVHDAEQAFGTVLSNWQEAAESLLAPAALELRVAEERLLRAAARYDPASKPAELLQLLDALLAAHDGIAASPLPQLAGTQRLVQHLALQAGLKYQAASGGDSAAAAQLAAVLAAHGRAVGWAAGLAQVQGGAVLPLLRALGSASLPISALAQVLAQCDLAHVPEADLPELASELVHLSPANQGDDASATQLRSVLQRMILSAGLRSDAAAEAASEALLQLLMAAAKGTKPGELGPALGVQGPLHVSAVGVSTLASWVFQPAVQGSSPQAVGQLVAGIDWDWVAEKSPPAMRLRWALAMVAAAKAALAGGGGEGDITRLLEGVWCGGTGWALCQPDMASTEEAYMLCMLEAPPSERAAVQALWTEIQTAAGLALCAGWIAGGGVDAAENVANLAGGAQLVGKVKSLCQQGRGEAALDAVGRVIEKMAGSPGLSCLLPTLSGMVKEALTASTHQQQHAVDAAAARAVQACLDREPCAAASATAGLALTLSSHDGATAPAAPAVHVQYGGDRAYAAVSTWLGLLLQLQAEHTDGGGALPDTLLQLLMSLTQAAYYLMPGGTAPVVGCTTRSVILAGALAQATAALTPAQLRQLQADLLGLQQPWLSLLAAWVGDTAALQRLMPGGSAAAATPEQLAVGLQALLGEAGAPSLTAEAAADEVLQLQEALKPASASFAALPLWHEFFLRLARHSELLRGGVLDRNTLIHGLGDTASRCKRQSGSLGAAAAQLMAFLSVNEGAVPPPLSPFLGSAAVAAELAGLDASWRQWAAAASSSTPVAQPSPKPPAGAAAGPSRVPPVDPSLLEFLSHRQHEQGEKLQEAAAALRLWARRGEKQAVRPAGEGPSPAEGREGDVPDNLAEAQQLLWDGGQRWSEEIAQLQLALRERVCKRYQTIDVSQLQAISDACEDGQRIPAPVEPRHGQQCADLRRRTRDAALAILDSKELVSAASELYKTEYLLLEGSVGEADGPQQAARVKSQLLLTLAHVLVDGSAPAEAAAYLTGLFERAIATGAAELDPDAKMQLVPRITRAMGPGGRRPLREREAVPLLRACLDPDAQLEAGRLRDNLTSLQLVLRLCRDVPGEQAASLLRSFDAQRLAVLVAEKAPAPNGSGAGSSSSSSPAKSRVVGVDEMLSLAADCLAQPGAEATGAAVLEGIVGLAPGAYFAACLGVALSACPSHYKDTTLGMLSRIPVEMLPDGVVAEALVLLTEALNHGHLPPLSLPLGLISALYISRPVVAGLHAGVADPAAAAQQQRSSGRGAAWSVRIGALAAATPDARPGGSGSSSAAAAAAAAGEAGGAEDLITPGTRVVVVAVPSAYQSCYTLFNALIDAVLQSLLRSVGGGLDGDGLCRQLEALLSILMGASGEQGGWLLQWLWLVYKESFQPFLALTAAASGGSTNGVFRQYWGSLPWAQASFHAASPQALAELRAYLPSPDGAAAELLHALDWRSPLAKARPVASLQPATVFSLGEEEEEEQAAAMDAVGDAYGRGLWAAELSLLVLHAGVLLEAERLPPWTRDLLYGQAPAERVQQPAAVGAAAGPVQASLLPAMLSGADWGHISGVITAPGLPAPWLLLPLLLAPQLVQGDAGGRVTHAATLLSRGAVNAGSPAAAAAAARATRPLLGFSVCRGFQVQQAAVAPRPRAPAPALLPHELVHIPDDIPPELLEGTVELEQLKLQQEELRLVEEQAAEAAAALAAAAAAPASPNVPVIEVAGCFRLTAAQHAALVELALVPLAKQHASIQLARTLALDHCPPFAEPPAAGDPSAASWTPGGSVLSTWRAPALSSLVSQVPMPDRLARKQASNAAAEAADKAAAIAALLEALVEQPATVLVSEPLPFANAEVPWSLASALYIDTAGQQQAPPPQRDTLRALRLRIAALVRGQGGGGGGDGGREGTAAPVDPSAELDRAVTTARALHDLIATLLEDACYQRASAPLASCLLRCVVVSETLQGMAAATLLADNLLRHLASPAAAAGRSLSARGMLRRRSPPSLEEAAAVVPVVSTENFAPTVTQMDESPGDSHGELGVDVPDSMRYAVAAAAGLGEVALLPLAQHCAALKRPLLAAFALEQLRQSSRSLDKVAWQALVVGVLQAALRAESNADHPLDVGAVWLEVLSWVNDSRWRRLPPGPHKQALQELLGVLDQRSELLQALAPDELLDRPAGAGEDAPPDFLSAAATRVRGGLDSGIKAIGSFVRDEDDGDGGSPLPLSRPAAPAASFGEIEAAPPPGVGSKLTSRFKAFGKQLSSTRHKLMHRPASDNSPDPVAPAAAPAAQDHPRPAHSPSRAPPPRTAAQLARHHAAERERDVLVRVGLTAFGVAAYVRSVMEPRMARRTASGMAQPGSPGGPALPTHSRGGTALTGSRHLEEQHLQELETVFEARLELDALQELAACPLLAADLAPFSRFLAEMPRLLDAFTQPAAFQAAVAQLLLSGGVAAQVLAVLRAEA